MYREMLTMLTHNEMHVIQWKTNIIVTRIMISFE